MKLKWSLLFVFCATVVSAVLIFWYPTAPPARQPVHEAHAGIKPICLDPGPAWRPLWIHAEIRKSMLGLGFPPADCPVQIDPFEHPFAAPFAEQPSAFLDHAVPPYFLAQGAMLIPHDLSDWAGSKVGKKYASELALRRWTNRIREQGANADSIARFVIKHGLVAEKALPDVVQLGKAASLIIAGPMLDARNQAYRIRSCQWIGNTLELRLLVFRTNDIHFISGERVPEYPLILIPFESKTVGRYLLRAVWERPTESGYEEWEVQELSFGVIE